MLVSLTSLVTYPVRLAVALPPVAANVAFRAAFSDWRRHVSLVARYPEARRATSG